MVDMAPEQAQREPASYLSLSKGWDDNGIGTLFSGLGDSLRMGVGAIDEGYKRLIKDDLRQQTDDIQNAHGGRHDLPTLRPETKDEIERYANRMRTYKQAMLMGNAKESTYWGALDASARQLRARYPGYRDHIDDVMKEFTGQNPANALLRTTRAEMEAAISKQDDPLKKYDALVQDMRKKGELPPDFQYGDPKYTYTNLFAMSAENNRKSADIAGRKAALELRQSEGKVDDEETGKLARTEYAREIQKKLLGSGTLFGKAEAEIEAIRKQVGTNTPTAEQSKQVAALAEQQIAELDKFYQGFMLDTNRGLGGKPYATALSQQHIKDIRDFTDNMKTDIRAAVASKELGFVTRAGRMAETLADSEKAAALGIPVIRELFTMSKVLGDAGMNIYLSQGDSLQRLSTVQKSYRDLVSTRTADPNKVTSLQEQFIELQKVGENKSALLQTVIDDQIRMIANPDMPTSNRIALIRSTYGEGNAAFLSLINRDPKTRGDVGATHKVFNTMANPAIAKSIWELSQSSGDSQPWQTYKNWVVNQTYALNAIDINTISRAQATAPGVNIRFSPEKMGFVIEQTPENVRSGRPGESPGVGAVRTMFNAYDKSWENKTLVDTINRINLSFQPLKDIADRDKLDRSEFITATLAAMQLRAESTMGRTAAHDSIVSKLVEVMYNQMPKNPIKRGLPPAYQQPGPEAELVPGAGKVKEVLDALPAGRQPLNPSSPARKFLDWFESKLPTKAGIDAARNQDRMGR